MLKSQKKRTGLVIVIGIVLLEIIYCRESMRLS